MLGSIALSLTHQDKLGRNVRKSNALCDLASKASLSFDGWTTFAHRVLLRTFAARERIALCRLPKPVFVANLIGNARNQSSPILLRVPEKVLTRSDCGTAGTIIAQSETRRSSSSTSEIDNVEKSCFNRIAKISRCAYIKSIVYQKLSKHSF